MYQDSKVVADEQAPTAPARRLFPFREVIMSRSAYLRSLRGVLVAGVVLSLLLVAPAAFNWAGRDGRHGQTQGQSPQVQMDEVSLQRWSRVHPDMKATDRPEGLTPFGKGFKAAEAR